MMPSRLLPVLALSAAVLAGGPSHAHHSFTVHYDSNNVVTKEGVVVEFRFTNPHGVLMLDVTNESGEVEHWTVETTSPTFMRRFGWTADMIQPGERITVEGWASRDGSQLMRMSSATREDGTPIGRGRQAAGDQ